MKLGVAMRRSDGVSPVSMLMNLNTLGDKGYKSLLKTDAEVFGKVCAAKAKERHETKRLPAALREVRKLENSTKWVVDVRLERAGLKGFRVMSIILSMVQF